MKTLFRLALLAVAAKFAYELMQKQRNAVTLPDGAPFEPAPVRPPPPEETPAGDDLTEVNGIGPVYAGKLDAVAVRSLADLVAADTEALSDDLDIAASVVAGWQQQARELLA